MLNNSLNFESLRILHHIVFTLTMKYLRYQVQHSGVINHVTCPKPTFWLIVQTGLDQFEKNQGGWKDVAMGDIAMASFNVFLKIKGAVHRSNLGDWGEFGCLKRLSAKQPKFAC